MSITKRSYLEITDTIVDLLKKGVVPWHKPWSVPGGEPQNLTSRKPYRGINPFLLNLTPYASPYWITFNQARKLGATVRKGEKASRIWFWKFWTPKQKQKDRSRNPGETDTRDRNSIPVLRRYSVFNVEQVDGLDGRVPELPGDERTEWQRIEAAEAIVEGMPQQPTIEHAGRAAVYYPTTDLVRMPERDRFKSGETYFSTLYHELTHASGHPSRLDRKGCGLARFGSPSYSREELVAEMGAAFLSGQAGIEHATLDASASYLDYWIGKLNGDPTLAVRAAGAAQ
ncbi:MAG: DUF1738 domain-containing protein, partial [Gammaproteobacteria bacterium]|nr:DUF1738 domain-containing protein [Gammaproteobacteria bacterium]